MSIINADKLGMMTKNKADEIFEILNRHFPNAVTVSIDENGKIIRAIDKDILMQEISVKVVSGREERYSFSWPDKKKSILLASAPINSTLRPCVSESVDFDNTENLYIEGDNLEVLKLLQETYLNKIKMIYIDPPYNTGEDLIYYDDYSEEMGEYIKRSGQYDGDGSRLVENVETNGRFHTDWLNMMYPRLKIARDLLSEDGFIFISIDDHEIANLKKICDEIYGEDNFINIVSIKLKNIAGASGGGEDRRLKKNMEYLLIYSKNRIKRSKLENVYTYSPLIDVINNCEKEGISWKYTTALIDTGEKEYVGSTQDGDGSEIRIYKRSNYIIKSINKIVTDESISEDEAYYKYRNCIFQTAMPQSSIRPRVMDKILALGVESDLYSIEYIPKTGRNKGKIYEQFYKGASFRLLAWLRDVTEEINGILYKKNLQGTYWDFVGETKNLTKEGDVSFPNGKKPVKLIQQMLKLIPSADNIVLDFFSGSATTAHAVMQLNAEDGGKRKFIMVQLQEPCDEKTESFKAGYKNICEIGKERIRRAGAKIKAELAEKQNGQKTLEGESDGINQDNLDIGFRVLKLDSSNMKDVYYTPSETNFSKLDFLTDNIKEDRTAEDLLFSVMLQLGIPLSEKIQQREISGKKIYSVAENYLIACFDDEITDDVITEIAKQKPSFAVFKDSGLQNDSVRANFDQIFNTYSKDTKRKVL